MRRESRRAAQREFISWASHMRIAETSELRTTAISACKGIHRNYHDFAALLGHFLPKFDNRDEESSRLSTQLASPATSTSAPRCLAISKKHSGHLVMCPPFFAKNRKCSCCNLSLSALNDWIRVHCLTRHALLALQMDTPESLR